MDGDPEIILPCLDEADALPVVLAALPAGWPVLVVDNGSTDATAAVARALGARVVTEPRRGYGAAVHAGLEAAQAELVAVLDGDGSIDPARAAGHGRPGHRGRGRPGGRAAGAAGPGRGRGTPGPATP